MRPSDGAASLVDVSYHPCPSKQSFFIVIFPLRLFVIGIAGEQAVFLYRRGRLALYPRQNMSRHDVKESVAIFLSIYDCVFIKPSALWENGIITSTTFCFPHTSTIAFGLSTLYRTVLAKRSQGANPKVLRQQ
jgi:hypothetical protein